MAEAANSGFKCTTNQAFIFIKPHAALNKCMEAVKKVVEQKLGAAGITINGDSMVIDSKQIDEQKLIDVHYYAIASKATLKKPSELNVPADKFEKKFGVSWEKALADGVVFNAIDGAEKLGGLDAFQLEKLWRKAKVEDDAMIKFGGGFYCAKIQDIYVFNGFFMSMRAAYVADGKQIVAYSVSWDEKDLSWEDFRGKVLGPTDPSKAPEDSIRGTIYREWEKLGLEKQPDTGDNGVHASASPYEGLAEHMNWLKQNPEDCAFGQTMMKSGISKETISAWSTDPQVIINSGGDRGSCFDAMEDMNSLDCVAAAVKLNLLNA